MEDSFGETQLVGIVERTPLDDRGFPRPDQDKNDLPG